MGVVVVATLKPLAEHRDDVVAALEAAIVRVHQEDDGCLLYALHESRHELVFVEHWADMDALKAHGQSTALTEMNAKLEGKLDGEIVVRVLRPHPAGDPVLGAIQ